MVALNWYEDPSETTKTEKLFVPEWVLQLRAGPDFVFFNRYNAQQTGGVGVELQFSRVFTIHLMQTFFPSIMIALSSVVSVFVPSDLVPGRMGLCITAFLSMISLFNGSRYHVTTAN